MQNLDEAQSYNIQILRGLAIIAVVFIHNTPIDTMQIWCRPFLNFSVGLFIFLSGMLSNAENWNPWKRIYKVIVPYVIWTMIYVIFNNYKTPINIPTSFLKNLATANASAMMYYIFVYCELTLLIPLIDKLAKSKYKNIGFLISPLEIIFIRLFPILSGYQLNKYISIVIHISCLGWFIYYYLGYMLGNSIIKIETTTKKLLCFLFVSVILQILEGYFYYTLGTTRNYGTQLKLSAILTGTIFVILAFRFLNSNKDQKFKFLKILGDYSFGIYFSHMAIMMILNKIPYYKHAVYPLNAIISILATLIFVFIGRKILGNYSKYFAL